MVVVIETRLGQPLRLGRIEHAQRHAGLQPHGLHALDHGDDLVHVAVLGAAPRRAHAKTLRARRLGLGRCRQNGLNVHQLLGLHIAFRRRALRAVTAILGAAAGLDRAERAKLHLVRRMMRAVDFSGAEQQFGKGQVEQSADLGAGPVGAQGRRLGAERGGRHSVSSCHSPVSGGILWPSSLSTSSAAFTRLVPGPKIACTPAS